MSEIPAQFSEDWLSKLDGRTRIARAVRDRLGELYADLGGEDSLSYQERSLCKRIVWLEALIETQELALARGEEVEQGRLTQSINALVGLLKTVGLDRRTREVPDLQSYLKRRSSS